MKTNFLLLLSLLLVTAAALGIMRARAKPTGLGFSPEVVAFTATPSVVHAGEPVTLTWQTRGTTSVAMEWGPEKPSRDAVELRAGLPSSGTMTVMPKADTVYELRCYTVAGPMCLPISATVRTR
jgi:hypothetical protein